MIELRWLDAPKFVGPDVLPDGMSVSIPRQQILQYRTWTDTTARTPWMDVPTTIYEQLPQGERSEKS